MVRIMSNLQACMLAFYLTYVLELTEPAKVKSTTHYGMAVFPFVAYFFSIVTSGQIGWLFHKMGRGTAFTLGCML